MSYLSTLNREALCDFITHIKSYEPFCEIHIKENMLIPRQYKPKSNELIYHYCDANTFHAICTNKTLRFCDVFSMNDFMEMHWGYSIWEKSASELLPELGQDFLDAIFHISGLKALALASCFSQDGDVLSQWRAYSNDGNGYVLGFRAKDLLRLPIKGLKVEYNEKKQIKEIKAMIKALHEVEESEDEKFGEDFINACVEIANDLTSYKNPAFSEEKEVRLVHLVNFIKSNNSLKIVDPGGIAFGKDFAAQEIKFLMSQNAPKTYLDIDFSNGEKNFPIKEVIIGPKNTVLSSAISVYLETLNIKNVEIKRSKASYR